MRKQFTMKSRRERSVSEQPMSSRAKSETLANNGPAVQRNQVQLANQQNSAQAIRKRRSSINVYDQPSSLNSRLRQLETDMLRLDEDRTKLFDDTHSALAQYELKLNEIYAILKSRQDSVEKYVEDMKMLLQAKDDFERQAKLLNEKHERIHEKFMHRETTISREIKLLKNKFELLEKSRQFRSILQKTTGNNVTSGDTQDANQGSSGDILDGTSEPAISRSGDTDSGQTSMDGKLASGQPEPGRSRKPRVRIKLSRLHSISDFFTSILSLIMPKRRTAKRRRFNRVGSVSTTVTNSSGGEEGGDDISSSSGLGLASPSTDQQIVTTTID